MFDIFYKIYNLCNLFYGALLFQVFQVYKVATMEMGIKHYMQHGTKVDYSLG